MPAINELIDPTFNGSGLLNVIIAASGAERRVREAQGNVMALNPDTIPEIVDYSLMLKAENGSGIFVREYSSTWQQGTTETYVGMPEQYRDTFEELRLYANGILSSGSASGFVDTTGRLPPEYHPDAVIFFPGGFDLVSDTGIVKNFNGGSNLFFEDRQSGSGNIPPFTFIGGNAPPEESPHLSTYNGSALPELIVAFESIQPSGGVLLSSGLLIAESLYTGTPPNYFQTGDINTFGWNSFVQYILNKRALYDAVPVEGVVIGSKYLREQALNTSLIFAWVPVKVPSGATNNISASMSVDIIPENFVGGITLPTSGTFNSSYSVSCQILLIDKDGGLVDSFFDDVDENYTYNNMAGQPSDLSAQVLELLDRTKNHQFSNTFNVSDQDYYFILGFLSIIDTGQIENYYDPDIDDSDLDTIFGSYSQQLTNGLKGFGFSNKVEHEDNVFEQIVWSGYIPPSLSAAVSGTLYNYYP